MAPPVRPFDGYPDSWGNQRASVFPHLGPTSYTQVTITPGTVPATGGDTAQAVEAGFKFFDMVLGGYTDDGAFKVEPIPVTVSAIVGGPSTTYKLRWIAQKTATYAGQSQTAGSEAVAASDLSTFRVRLLGIGPK